jgi:hypothetical protein
MTYGKEAAANMLTEYHIVALAALNGDVAALTQLVETTEEFAYAAGFGAAVTTSPVGFPL